MIDCNTGLDGFTRAPDDWRWPVYRLGTGPPVIVMHEFDGLTPEVIAFARRLHTAGFSVWLPVIAGPTPSTSRGDRWRARIRVCVSREMYVLWRGHTTSPIVDELRSLTSYAAEECGRAGVGVVGMCLTGGFALALAGDACVLAAVTAQPSVPFRPAFFPWCQRDLGISTPDLETIGERITAGEVALFFTRFSADWISPRKRAAMIEARWGGASLTVDTLNSGKDNPYGFRRTSHSVLSVEPCREQSADGVARLEQTFAEVVTFLAGRLGLDPA